MQQKQEFYGYHLRSSEGIGGWLHRMERLICSGSRDLSLSYHEVEKIAKKRENTLGVQSCQGHLSGGRAKQNQGDPCCLKESRGSCGERAV